jgi:hypothetical protein
MPPELFERWPARCEGLSLAVLSFAAGGRPSSSCPDTGDSGPRMPAPGNAEHDSDVLPIGFPD